MAEPAVITMVHGVELGGLLHDLQDVVIPGGPLVLRCGIRTTEPAGAKLWTWTPEDKAPTRCPDCRDLPPFWAD